MLQFWVAWPEVAETPEPGPIFLQFFGDYSKTIIDRNKRFSPSYRINSDLSFCYRWPFPKVFQNGGFFNKLILRCAICRPNMKTYSNDAILWLYLDFLSDTYSIFFKNMKVQKMLINLDPHLVPVANWNANIGRVEKWSLKRQLTVCQCFDHVIAWNPNSYSASYTQMIDTL